MTWLLLLFGLALASLGSAGAAALVTTARTSLAEAISRRLRGAQESLDWLAVTECQVVAATAATSLGVALFGAAIPGVVVDATPLEIVLLVFFVAVPVTLLGAYLLPRWLTATRTPDAFMPFGAGARMCIGNHLALLEATLITATLLRDLSVNVLDGGPKGLHPSVTLKPGGPVMARFTPAE